MGTADGNGWGCVGSQGAGPFGDPDGDGTGGGHAYEAPTGTGYGAGAGFGEAGSFGGPGQDPFRGGGESLTASSQRGTGHID